MTRVFAAVLFMTFCSLTGCILAPALDSVRQAGFTSTDRQALLPKEVKKFHDAIAWGNSTLALSFVSSEAHDALRDALKKETKHQKNFEGVVQSVEFDDSAYEADVEVRSRSYGLSTLVVQNQLHSEHWHFTLTGGWKLTSRVLTVEDE